jgi:hypothetical protein
MRRSIWCWLAGSLLLGAAARAGAVPVAWVSPPAGAVWDAGESVTLEWRRTGSWPRELRVEEWEAFLSLDGGRTFPVRLTPHLDADLRAVRVPVPNLPSDNARLLLRFGDERREIEWLVPGEFTIRADRLVARVLPEAVAALPPDEERGEAARAGDPGVVFWAEGRRDGGEWRAASAAPVWSWRPAVESDRGRAGGAASAESPSVAADCRRPCRISPRPPARETRAPSARSQRGIPILHLVERLNE